VGGAGGSIQPLLAVPAGAVYYFEADSVDEGPRRTPPALNWHGAQAAGIAAVVNRRSSLLGEKGFGLGVCGTWKPGAIVEMSISMKIS
jgi:hypothetical protein